MDTLSEAEIEPSVDQEEKSPKGTLKKKVKSYICLFVALF